MSPSPSPMDVATTHTSSRHAKPSPHSLSPQLGRHTESDGMIRPPQASTLAASTQLPAKSPPQSLASSHGVVHTPQMQEPCSHGMSASQVCSQFVSPPCVRIGSLFAQPASAKVLTTKK